jgi:hypothetical protein
MSSHDAVLFLHRLLLHCDSSVPSRSVALDSSAERLPKSSQSNMKLSLCVLGAFALTSASAFQVSPIHNTRALSAFRNTNTLRESTVEGVEVSDVASDPATSSPIAADVESKRVVERERHTLFIGNLPFGESAQ